MPVHERLGDKGMPEIVATEGVLGGKARIRGRRISVVDIVELLETGNGVEDVADEFDLRLEEVKAARRYAEDHPEEIEASLQERRELYEQLTNESSV